jgi:hypothetical protein
MSKRRVLPAFANRHKYIDFDAINQAALAAFPAVLVRVLPGGKRVGSEYLALNPRRNDNSVGPFPLTSARAGGVTSRPATRAAIQFRLSRISSTFRKSRRLVFWRECSASKPGCVAMDDAFDFSPLTDSERKATHEQAHVQVLETVRPTIPPGDAEAPEAAAARLFRRAPDALYPYRNPEGSILFWVCRWNNRTDGKASKKSRGSKKILPLCWFASGDGASPIGRSCARFIGSTKFDPTLIRLLL